MNTPRRSARQYYRPELHAVRFLAFLLVFLHHAFPNDPDVPAVPILRGFDSIFYAVVDACSFGLCLFFTLSAFLIAELLLREKQATGSIESKQFYIRRILRIWPLYYLALALGALSVFLPGGQPNSAMNLGWFAIFMGSWLFVHNGLIPDLVYHLWSISVEEQFYLFAPWILKYLSRRSLYVFCFLLGLTADAWLFHLGRMRTDDDAIWCSSIVQFQCFAFGILLCLVLRGRLPQLNLGHRLLLFAGSCVCWFVTCYCLHYPFFSASMNPGSWHLIGAYALISLGSVMVLVAFLGLNPKLIPRWAVYFGRISFGLYVFHIAALRLVLGAFPHTGSHHIYLSLLKIAISLGLTVLAAALSYRYFETPFLKLKQRHAIIESQPI
jgi:peptidoglycan/LPS O-acetylase OafA/YrhL